MNCQLSGAVAVTTIASGAPSRSRPQDLVDPLAYPPTSGRVASSTSLAPQITVTKSGSSASAGSTWPSSTSALVAPSTARFS